MAGSNVPKAALVIPVPDQVPPTGIPPRLKPGSFTQFEKSRPAFTTGNGFTVNNIVSRTRQFPTPLEIINSNVPATVGSKTPSEFPPGPAMVRRLDFRSTPHSQHRYRHPGQGRHRMEQEQQRLLFECRSWCIRWHS